MRVHGQSTVRACRLCNDPVYQGLDVHPCCVFWLEEQRHRFCVACVESKRARREWHRREHTASTPARASDQNFSGRLRALRAAREESTT